MDTNSKKTIELFTSFHGSQKDRKPRGWRNGTYDVAPVTRALPAFERFVLPLSDNVGIYKDSCKVQVVSDQRQVFFLFL